MHTFAGIKGFHATRQPNRSNYSNTYGKVFGYTYIYMYVFVFVLPVRVVISVAQGLHPRSLELTVFASIDCRCGCILRHFHKIQIRPSSSQKNNHFSQKRDLNPGSGPAGFNAPSVDFKVVHGLTGGLILSLGLYTGHTPGPERPTQNKAHLSATPGPRPGNGIASADNQQSAPLAASPTTPPQRSCVDIAGVRHSGCKVSSGVRH